MPVPDFSPGEVLTAAAMDSIGLWLVSTTTVGTGVPSVPVANCFSSNYQNYRVVISGIDCSVTDNLFFMTLSGSAGATYVYSTRWNNYGTGAFGGSNSAGATAWVIGLTSTVDNTNLILDVQLPNISNRRTTFSGMGSSDSNMIFGGGQDTNLVAHTGFSLITVGGVTMTGGTIRVYGYRN